MSLTRRAHVRLRSRALGRCRVWRVEFAGDGLGCFAAVGAGAFQKADEGGELFGRELAEELDGYGLDDGIHLTEQVESGVCDTGPDDASVARVAVLHDELEGLEASEQAGDVGNGGEHAVADGGAGEATGMGAAEDAEDVVLRAGNVPVADAAVEGALEAVCGAEDVEQGLFLGSGEGPLLGNFALEAGHAMTRFRG
jgi:hypothetical protein